MFKILMSTAKHPYAAFALPAVHWAGEPGLQLYVAVRNTPPFQGLYSVIGGKVERNVENTDIAAKLPDRSSSSFGLESEGWERPSLAAVREFCEEMYTRAKPELIVKGDVLSMRRIVRADDEVTGTSCYVRLMIVPGMDFSPNSREIGDIKPLKDVSPRLLNPLTQVTIRGMYELPGFENFRDQLPRLEDLTVSCEGPCEGNHYVFGYAKE